MTGGQILTCFFALLIGLFNIGSLGPWFQSVAEAKIALGHVRELLDDTDNDADKSKTTTCRDELEDENSNVTTE